MRISVEDGIVVCSLENKKSGFISAAYDYFKGFYNNKLKIHVDVSTDADETARAEKEFWTMISIEILAAKYNVSIDSTFYERKKLLKPFVEAAALARRNEESRKRQHWELLCKYGCGSCKKLRMDGDDHRCAASGDLLEDKNVPKYIGTVHYLFNYEAFPSDNCPFKVN